MLFCLLDASLPQADTCRLAVRQNGLNGNEVPPGGSLIEIPLTGRSPSSARQAPIGLAMPCLLWAARLDQISVTRQGRQGASTTFRRPPPTALAAAVNEQRRQSN
jgi:hypothetical protein